MALLILPKFWLLVLGQKQMCQIWTGNKIVFKKCAMGKKSLTLNRLRCWLFCLNYVLFFCLYTMVYVSIIAFHFYLL